MYYIVLPHIYEIDWIRFRINDSNVKVHQLPAPYGRVFVSHADIAHKFPGPHLYAGQAYPHNFTWAVITHSADGALNLSSDYRVVSDGEITEYIIPAPPISWPVPECLHYERMLLPNLPTEFGATTSSTQYREIRNRYTDVAIYADGTVIHTHRAILCVKSVYFRDMFDEDPNTQPIINGRHTAKIIDAIYGTAFYVNDPDIIDILQSATCYFVLRSFDLEALKLFLLNIPTTTDATREALAQLCYLLFPTVPDDYFGIYMRQFPTVPSVSPC